MAKFMLSAFADEAGDSLSAQIAALKRNGIPLLEPRSVEGAVQEKTLDEVKAIRAALDEADIGVSAFGSPIGKFSPEDDFEPQLASFRHAMDICDALGTKRMRIFSYKAAPEVLTACREEIFRRLRIFADEAKARGITLCHENEKKIYGQDPEHVRELLSGLPTLRGIFDAANYICVDDDVLDGLEATLPKLEYIHVKDATLDGHFMTPVGEGDGQYAEVLRRVDKATDATVILTLEPHLFVFQHYKNIDDDKLAQIRKFENADAAFDCAATALKEMLKNLGFHEEGKVWTR